MSTIKAHYRLRVYASDDVTILTPAATAPHADKCLISTLNGVSDGNGSYKAYLDYPSGRRGRFDPLLKQTDVGEYTARIMDVRVTPGGSNAVRWFNGFLGDAGGTEQLKGLLVQWDESRDNGATWSRWFTGRIHQVEVKEPLYFALTMRDTSDELVNIDCFTGDPHASINYVAREQLLPFGLTQAYGPFPAATAAANSGKLLGTAITGGISVNSTSIHDLNNVVTSRFVAMLSGWTVDQAATGYGMSPQVPQSQQDLTVLRAKITHLSGAHSGSTYDYPVWFFHWSDINGDGHAHIDRFGIDVPTSLNPIPAVGVAVSFVLYTGHRATSNTPLFIGDVDPITLWQDLLGGKFGRLSSGGSVLRSVAYNAAAFAALAGQFGTVRYIVDDISNLHDWIEKNILQPLGLGYYVNNNGEIVPIDCRLPAALGGLPTFADADLGEQAPEWLTTRDTAYAWFSCTHWMEQVVSYANMQRLPDMFPNMPPGGINATEYYYALTAIGPRLLNLQSLDNTGLGLRSSGGELLQARDRETAIEAQISGVLNSLATRFAAGAYEASLPQIRVASADSVNVGDFFLGTFTVLPDPASNRRGAQRLLQVTEKNPGPLYTEIKALDAGLSTTASVPSLGVMSQFTGDERHSVNIPVTLDANSDPVRVDGAITATSVGSAPGATDPLWHQLGKVTTSTTLVALRLPSGMRLWVRARSEPSSGYQFPSAFVTAAAPHLDTQAVTAPSALGSVVTGTRVLVSWTNGDSILPVRLYLVTPIGTPVPVFDLPPGSTQYTFEALQASTSYTFGVAHPDGLGGSSAITTANFTTSTATRTAPAPGGLTVVIGVTV